MTIQNILFDRFVKWHVKKLGHAKIGVFGVVATGDLFLDNGKISSVNLGNGEAIRDIFGDEAYSEYGFKLWHDG